MQEEVPWEATGDEEEWMEKKTERNPQGRAFKIHPVEKTYSEEAQEALYNMEQFFQKESVRATGEKTEGRGGKKKEDCLSKYQAWYQEVKELKANLTTEEEIPEEPETGMDPRTGGLWRLYGKPVSPAPIRGMV